MNRHSCKVMGSIIVYACGTLQQLVTASVKELQIFFWLLGVYNFWLFFLILHTNHSFTLSFFPSPFPNVFSIPHPLLRKYYTFSFFTSYELPVLCIIWKEKQHIGMGRWVNRNWHTHYSTGQRGNKTGSLKSHVHKKNSLALIHSNLYQESPYIQKFDFIDDPLGKGEKT